MQCQSSCKPFSIFLGDTKTMPINLIYELTGFPVDLTDCTQIIVYLPNANGSQAQLDITPDATVTIISPAILGQFYASISGAISSLLRVGENQDIIVSYTISGAQKTVRIPNCLSVYQP